MNWSVILTSMLPEHLLLVGMLAILGLEIRSGHSRDGFALAVLSVGAAAAAALWLFVTGYLAEPFPQHFLVDPASSLSKAVLIALALPVLLISRDDFAETPYYTLVLASLYGACLIVSSTSFPTLFLGIEIMSLPVYALVLLGLLRAQSAEAALKYLVLGGAATATLLMGIAFLYGWSGSLAIATFPFALASSDPLALAGVALVIAALFLKGMWPLAAAFAIGGFGWALVNVNSLPMVVDMTDDARVGTYTGLYYLFSTLAAIAGPNINGQIVTLTGRNYSLIMIVGPIFMALALLMMLGVRRGEARSQPVSSRPVEEPS